MGIMIWNCCTLVLFLVCLLTDGQAKVTPDKISAEMRLIQDLFDGYNNMSRPRINSTEAVEVEVAISLIILRDLSEQQQVMKTYLWVDMFWNDEYLRWDPDDYNNITRMVLPQNKVWLPDAAIENSAGGIYGDVYDSKIRIRVSSNGDMWYAPSGQVETTCSIDLQYFPFDTQTCDITFSNWIYIGAEVVLTNGSDIVSLAQFEHNGQWEVVETKMYADAYLFNGVNYPTATGTIILKRKPLFYLIYVGLPCILLSGLSLLVFWIPPHAGERIALGITVLLSFSVFQLLLLEKMPESSDKLPILGIYLMLVMMNTSLSLVLSIVVLNVYFPAEKQSPPPRWAKRFLMEWMAKLLCMEENQITSKTESRKKMSQSQGCFFLRTAPVIHSMSNGTHESKCGSQGHDSMNTSHPGVNNKPHDSSLQSEDGPGTKTLISVKDEWKSMAKVLDRFFFALVATMDLLMTLCCMLIVPLVNSGKKQT